MYRIEAGNATGQSYRIRVQYPIGRYTPRMLLIVCRLIVFIHPTIDAVNVKEVFGQNIKCLRKEQGLSQEALAAKAGLHRTYVGAVERGERNITLGSANRIAQALSVPLSELLKDHS